jgi:hypothetical protein
LRETRRPVPVAELHRRFGRGVPPSAVYLDKGVVTTPARIPRWDSWRDRLASACHRIMSDHSARRRWTTAELLPLLREALDLPPWCNAWSLGSVLRDADGIRWLGRNRVTLARRRK